MAYIMYLIGIISVIVGGWWTVSAFNEYPEFTTSSYVALAYMTVSAPGLALLATGFVFMAIGEALVRLADIHRNTRRTTNATLDLLDAIQPRATSDDVRSDDGVR